MLHRRATYAYAIPMSLCAPTVPLQEIKVMGPDS